MTDNGARVVETGAMARSAYRQVGVWTEEAWNYEVASGHAVKRYRWECEAVAVKTGEALRLAYFTRNEVPTGRMEDMAFVLGQEGAALRLLERVVEQATKGIGYIPIQRPTDYLLATTSRLVEQWIAAGGYPDEWKQQLEQAITVGGQAYLNAMAAAQALGADNETDAELAQFGWPVPIVAVELPLVSLA